MSLSLCIIGDINVDIITDITQIFGGDFDAIARAKHVAAPIEWSPGGTGALMAVAAIERGIHNVYLIGKVGADVYDTGSSDLAGRYLVSWLERCGVRLLLSHDPRNQTGMVMMTFSSQDRRIMVANAGANRTFCEEDINVAIQDAVASVDMLFVSGYSLLVPERAAAVRSLMRLAHGQQTFVVLDVVPHQIYMDIDSDDFISLLKYVDLIVSEVNTLKRLLFANDDQFEVDCIGLLQLWKRLSRVCIAAILRPDNNHQVLFGLDNDPILTQTNYSQLTASLRRGFSERLTLDVLVENHKAFMRLAAIRMRNIE